MNPEERVKELEATFKRRSVIEQAFRMVGVGVAERTPGKLSQAFTELEGGEVLGVLAMVGTEEQVRAFMQASADKLVVDPDTGLYK